MKCRIMYSEVFVLYSLEKDLAMEALEKEKGKGYGGEGFQI